MEAKVVKSFIDTHTKKPHKVGEVFSLTQKRFDEIQKKGNFVQAVAEKQKA